MQTAKVIRKSSTEKKNVESRLAFSNGLSVSIVFVAFNISSDISSVLLIIRLDLGAVYLGFFS